MLADCQILLHIAAFPGVSRICQADDRSAGNLSRLKLMIRKCNALIRNLNYHHGCFVLWSLALKQCSMASQGRPPTLRSHCQGKALICIIYMWKALAFVIFPALMVSRVAFSRISQKSCRASFLSSLARWARPRVQAKIEATGFVDVGWPFWYCLQWRVTVPACCVTGLGYCCMLPTCHHHP